MKGVGFGTRVALVGCGAWGRNILRDLIALGCDVHVVARSDASVRRAKEGGAARTVRDIGDLKGVAAAVVATPTDTHYVVTLEVLTRHPSIPVFVEKPLCNDPAHAAHLLRIAGDRVFVMDKWRYHAGVLALAQIARERALGRVIGVKLRRLSWGSAHDDSNAAWHLLPHDLAIALEILGELPKPQAARMDAVRGRVRGMTALLGADPWVHIEVSERFEQYQRETRLFCDDAVAVLGGGSEESLAIYRGAPRAGDRLAPERRPFTANMPLFEELRVFVDYVRGQGAAPKSDCATGAAMVETIGRLHELSGHGASA